MGSFVEVTSKIDPLKKFQKATKQALVDSCGLIPYFVLEAATVAPKGASDVLAAMNKAYGFGFGGNMTGGSVSTEGVYSYPEDPDLYPLAHMEIVGLEGTIADVFIYQYAIVAVRDNRETIVTRMD